MEGRGSPMLACSQDFLEGLREKLIEAAGRPSGAGDAARAAEQRQCAGETHTPSSIVVSNFFQKPSQKSDFTLETPSGGANFSGFWVF